MNEEKIEDKLLSNAVRMKRQDDVTIGTGYLYLVPEEETYAYILTAAHIFDEVSYPIRAEVYSEFADREDYNFQVTKDQIKIYDGYIPGKGETEYQKQDAAIVKVPFREWMRQYKKVNLGRPYKYLKVNGIVYSAASTDPDIRYDHHIVGDTALRDFYEDSLRMRITVKGNFLLNHANREGELSGMSGSAFFADVEGLFLVGIFVSIAAYNGAFCDANLLKVDPFVELLEKEGAKPVVLDMVRTKDSGDGTKAIKVRSTNTVVPDRHFVCREQELQTIKERLVSNGLLILTGMGGIGKTALARQYVSAHRTDYKAVYQVSCSDSILNGLARSMVIPGLERLESDGIPESDTSLGRRMLEWMKTNGEDKVLYLFDDVSPKDKVLKEVEALGADKIITTRWSKDAWSYPVYEVKALEELDSRKWLFEQYFDRKLLEEEMDDFEAIDRLINGHTLTLALIAIQCRESAMPLKVIRKKLEEQGIFTEDDIGFPYGETQEERNMYGHIRMIWNFSEWDETEKWMMELLCLIPPMGMEKQELHRILGSQCLDRVNRLRRKGWIQETVRGTERWISLHNVISEVVYREIYQQSESDFTDYIGYIENQVYRRDLPFTERCYYISCAEHMIWRLKDGSNKLDLMLILVQQYENLRDIDLAKSLLKQMKQQISGLALEDSIYQGHYHNNLALIFQREGRNDKALIHFRRAKKIYLKCGPSALGNYGLAVHNEANVLYHMGEYKEALALEDEAEPILAEHNRKYLGYVYDLWGDYCAYKAGEFNEYLSTAEGMMAEIFLKKIRSCIEHEVECMEKAVELKIKYQAPMHEIMRSKASRACAYAFAHRGEEAVREIKEVLAFFEETTKERSEEIAHTYDKMCLIYEKCGDTKKACHYGEMAVDIFTELFGEHSPEVLHAQGNLKVAQGS